MERLNIPMKKRSYDSILFAVACAGLGVWIVDPNTIEGWMTGTIVMGPAHWFLFRGARALNKWHEFQRYIFKEIAAICLRLGIYWLCYFYISPYMLNRIGVFLSA